MDARTVSHAAGIPLGTLNVWVQRGQLPFLPPGVRGKRRDINHTTAIKIAVFAQMMKFGIAPNDASDIVKKLGSQIFGARYVLVYPPHAHVINNDAELVLQSCSYLIINLEVLNARLLDRER